MDCKGIKGQGRTCWKRIRLGWKKGAGWQRGMAWHSVVLSRVVQRCSRDVLCCIIVVRCGVVLCFFVLCYAPPCCPVLRHVLCWCSVVLCAVLRCALLCHAVLCCVRCVALCRAILCCGKECGAVQRNACAVPCCAVV